MGLSRRAFTKEFKLAPVRRLEQREFDRQSGTALEVNLNVLHRWRHEVGRSLATCFQARESNAGPKGESRNWNARSASKR